MKNLNQMIDPANAKSNLNRAAVKDLMDSVTLTQSRTIGAKTVQQIAAVFTHGSQFNMPQKIRGLNCPKTFTVGTQAGYADENGEDLKAALDRAEKNGHSTDPWANPSCSVIASDETVWCDKMINDINNPELEFGNVVLIEGSYYEIERVPYNRDQIKLSRLTVAEAINVLTYGDREGAILDS